MGYDFRNDWLLLKSTGDIPSEIIHFLEDTFLICEIRGQVGRLNGIRFEVRSREGNHTIPHIHSEYSGYSISISITDGTVLAGNLPKQQQKAAIAWVLSNKEMLFGKWKDIAISATSITTKSRLDSLEYENA